MTASFADTHFYVALLKSRYYRLPRSIANGRQGDVKYPYGTNRAKRPRYRR